jgi:molybdopterin-guanine dinucleotide biosynthesis protein A
MTRADPAVVGLVLAGGRSRRFPGGHKALETVAGVSMIERVISRLSPQVDETWLSVGTGEHPFVPLGLRCLSDDRPRFRGPLAGLKAGLDALATRDAGEGPAWLLLAPCDAPFLPNDLVQKLLRSDPGDDHSARVVIPRIDDHLQPTFAAWRLDAREAVDAALEARGGLGLLDVVRSLPHRVVDWPAETPPPFFNVNTREDLATAAHWLQSGTSPETG